MKVKLFLVFTILITLVAITIITVNLDFATSVVPGWHSTILPPFFIGGLLLWWLSLVVFLYLVFSRKAFTRNNFIFYLSISLPCLLLIGFFRYAAGLEGERQMSILILMPVFLICLVAYSVAQVWFLVKILLSAINRIRR